MGTLLMPNSDLMGRVFG